jgi:nucleoside-diphosphate-sugar epimerase
MHYRRRVLVTGAGGFVGRHMVSALRSSSLEVVATTRSPGSDAEHRLDITDRAAVDEFFRAMPVPDVVVHLAAIAHQKRGGVADEDYDAVNHLGLRHVLEAARRSGVEQMVFASSAAVYGDIGRDGPVSEDVDRCPVGAYAQSKYRAEEACFAAIAQGFRCAILRFPAIYSREWLLNVRKRAYVPFTGERVLLRVLGEQPKYSLCAIQHAVSAVMMGTQGRLASGAYNVADGEPYLQSDVGATIGALDDVSLTLPLVRQSVRIPLAALSPFVSEHVRLTLWNDYWKLLQGLVLSISKIEGAGFQPVFSLKQLLSASA